MIAAIAAKIRRTTLTPLAGGIVLTFGAKLFGVVIALITSVIIARSLGPEGRGTFAVASALAAIGLQLSGLGLPSSNTYFLTRKAALLSPILANSIIVAAVVGSAIATGLWVYAVLSGTASHTAASAIGWALASIPILLASQLLNNLLIPTGRVVRFNIIEVGYKIFALGLVTGIAVSGWSSATSFQIAGLIAGGGALLAAGWSLGLSQDTLSAASPSLLWRQIPFSLKAYLALFLGFLLLRIDMLMVQAISGDAEAGLYSIAVAISDMVAILPLAAATLLFPKLVIIAELNEQRRNTINWTLGIGVLTSAIALVAVLTVGWVILVLFGKDYEPAADMFHILAPAIVLFGMINIVSQFHTARGFPWSAVWIWGLGVAVNVTANLFLISRFGGVGAAWGSLIAYAMVLAAQIFLMMQEKVKSV